MRRRWIKLLTALCLAMLIAILPICATAAEGAVPQTEQQENDGETATQDEGQPDGTVPGEPGEDGTDGSDGSEPGAGSVSGEPTSDASPEPDEPEPDASPAPDASPKPDASPEPAASPEPDEDADWSLLKTGGHSPYCNGYSGGLFKPDNGIKRAEVAQMIYNLLKEKPKNPTANFPDAVDHWGYKAIAALYSLKVIAGDNNGKFRPEDSITRAEFTKILSNCFKVEKATCNFPDVPTDHWAYSYIANALAKGWVSGYNDGTFRPSKAVTRAEVVKMLNGALGRRDAGFAADQGTQEFVDVPFDHWAFKEIAEAANPVQTSTPSPSPDPGDNNPGDKPSNTIQVGSTVQVNADALNIRSAPSTSGNIVTQAYQGDLLTVTDTSKAPSWYGVKTSNGTTGYASGDYLKLYTGSTTQSGTLSATSLTINQYMSARLDATASEQVRNMKWATSDVNVARVGYTINYDSKTQSAIVYAAGPGTATLTYSDAAGNTKATCTVTVTAAEPVRFAYPAESIVQTGTNVDLIAITDNTRDAVRFDVAGGGSYTSTSYTAESSRSSHGLPANNTRVFTSTVQFAQAGTYTVRAYASKDGEFATAYKEFTVQIKDKVDYTETTTEVRKLSSKGMAAIRDFEGTVSEVEDDRLVSGNPTVGCGYVVPKNETFYNNLTNTEAYALLARTANEGAYAKAVERFRKNNGIKMSQGQFDALVSWVYNVGTGWLDPDDSDLPNMLLNMVVPPTTATSGKINTSSNTNPARLYQSTSTTSTVLATIPRNTTVTVTDHKVLRSKTQQQVWYKVSYNGQTGWVGSGYVKLNGTRKIDLDYVDSTSLATELLLFHIADSVIYEGLAYRRLAECKMFFFGNYDEGKPNGIETPNYRKNTYGFVYPERIKYLDQR